MKEIGGHRQQGAAHAQAAVDIVRRHYLAQLQAHTGRNVIAYYSGWLSKPGILQTEINDEDKNGFMMAVHKLDKSKGLDLILHTPGGRIDATESIVNYLHKKFSKDIRAIVPQIAMSAGTMMACSCKKIFMADHSNLGPIDPHLNGIPAKGVVDEFERAYKEIKADPAMFRVWEPILKQYRPAFLAQCEHAIKWSQQFVEDHLATIMFAADKSHGRRKAKRITKSLLDYRRNRTHARHFHLEDCKKMGLDVERIEDNPAFQDLVLTVHHCYMHSLMNTNSFKIIENHLGAAFVKQQQVVQVRQ